MANSKNRKKTSVTLFILIFAAVVIVMFVARQQSVLVEEIRFPLNNGVSKLSTWQNSLVAFSLDKKIYVWDWNHLSKEYSSCSVQSDQAGLLKSDLVISVPRQNPHAAVITNVSTNQVHKEIPVYSTAKRAFLKVSPDQSSMAIVLEDMLGSDKKGSRTCEILVGEGDFSYLRSVAKLTSSSADCELKNFDISNDGAFVTLFGTKHDCGWLVLVDVDQRKIVWEKKIDNFVLCFNAVFSPDNRVIYARGSDSSVYEIETASGKVLEQLLPVRDNKSTLTIQPVQTVTVSPNGRLIAATVSSTVYVWDCKTNKKLFTISASHKLISGIAFSPDGRLLATSDLRQGGTIKIWRMPEN